MMKYVCFIFLFLSSFSNLTQAQELFSQRFNRYDSLRGTLSPLRSCYDVVFYDLNIRVNPVEQSIKGFNTIYYKATADFNKIQVDLFRNLHVSRIIHHNQDLTFERDSNAVFITYPQIQKKDLIDSITISYEGQPVAAQNPPWDGGFTWEKDRNAKDWIGVSCEGIGASLWWPNKDHLSDEPDSMKISCEVPSALMCVSNGNLRRSAILTDGFTRYDWFVSYPINNYNVTLNIADYEQFSDSYIAQDGDKLALSFYVLRYNVDKARKQFEQVKPMLAYYEKLFGKYPFWKDGYALVETPYLGMEHQGAIAYGNKYLQGYAGQDPSGTGIGLTFDYIIIHESGHEYWGNSVSAQDHGEMWIHESFCTYTEALYVECMQNKDAASKYMVGLRELIENKEPIIAPLGVNASGSADMYYKGANILHTLRHVIDNDKLWFEILHGIAQEFKNKTTNTQEIIQFINTKAGKDFTPFFDQYLRHTKLPVFQYMLRQRGKKVTLEYRWQADVPNFQMPLKVDLGDGNYIPVTPSQHWQTITQKGNAGKFKVANDQYYIAIQKVESEKTKP